MSEDAVMSEFVASKRFTPGERDELVAALTYWRTLPPSVRMRDDIIAERFSDDELDDLIEYLGE